MNKQLDKTITKPEFHALRVLLVIASGGNARRIETELADYGVKVCACLQDARLLLRVASEECPDFILIDADRESSELLALLQVISEQRPVPVALFCRVNDPDYIRQALETGVTSYIVGEMDTARVASVIDVASIRFAQMQALQDTLSETQTELESRREIDRAKYLLMKRYGLTEQEAYDRLRKAAMNASRPLVEIAQDLLNDTRSDA